MICSAVPHSWIGASARKLARLPVAAPPSTHASSNAASDSARFFGPAMNPPSSGSIKAEVIPARSKASIISAFAGVHSCVLRSPAATICATVVRATVRADCTSICRSKRSANRHWIWRTASPGSVCMVFTSGAAAVAIDLNLAQFP